MVRPFNMSFLSKSSPRPKPKKAAAARTAPSPLRKPSLFVFYAKDAIIIAKIDARKMNDITSVHSDGADAAYFDCGQPLHVDSWG
jgi:hypothetical protein